MFNITGCRCQSIYKVICRKKKNKTLYSFLISYEKKSQIKKKQLILKKMFLNFHLKVFQHSFYARQFSFFYLFLKQNRAIHVVILLLSFFHIMTHNALMFGKDLFIYYTRFFRAVFCNLFKQHHHLEANE